MMAFTNEKKTGNVTCSPVQKKEKIRGSLILYPGSAAILDVSWGDVHGTAALGEVQYAQNQPLTRERVGIQMEKLGNTPYEWESLEIQMDDSVFVPMKLLNELRRQALAALEEEILQKYRRQEPALASLAPSSAKKSVRKKLPIYVSCEDIETALALYKREGIRGMYLPFSAMKQCLKAGTDRGLEMYLALPHIIRGELPEGYLQQAREWLNQGMTGFLVRNLEAFVILQKAGLAEKCVLDHSMYTWNNEAVAFWEEQKVLKDTIPLELNEGELRHRDNSHSEMLVYGYLPLMMSAQCVRKNVYRCDHSEGKAELKDRYDKKFTAACFCNPWKMENTGDKTPCYNIIYNSIPYGLLREREQVRKLGPVALRLSFTIEDQNEAVRILDEFVNVYQNEADPPQRDYTKGHFKRGAE